MIQLRFEKRIFSLLILCAARLTAAQASLQEDGVLHFEYSHNACAFLSAPGDIVLQHYGWKWHFSPKFTAMIKAKEVLSLNFENVARDLRFGHSEIITESTIQNGNLVTWSFFPPYFQKNKPENEKAPKFMQMDYKDLDDRFSYSVYRMNHGALLHSALQMREQALIAVEHREDYPALGTCASFINWLFGNSITTWWNRIPGVRQAVASVAPNLWQMTPDDIADSPYVVKLCKVDKGIYVGPQSILLVPYLNDLKLDLKSENLNISKHARESFYVLKEQNLIDQDGNALVSKVRISIP